MSSFLTLETGAAKFSKKEQLRKLKKGYAVDIPAQTNYETLFVAANVSIGTQSFFFQYPVY